MIDVCLPLYRPNPTLLKKALDGLMAQTYTNWQLWICEEPTGTDVLPLLTELFKDPRVHYHKNPKRLGIGGNWNMCAGKGNGTFLAFLFQDDAWNPEYLTTAVDALEKNPTAGFVTLNHRYDCTVSDMHAHYDWVEEAREKIAPGLHKGHTFLRDWRIKLLRPNVIGEPSFVVMQSHVFEQTKGFDESMKQLLDVDMWVQLLKMTDVVFVPGNFGTFHVHSGGASAGNHKSMRGVWERVMVVVRSWI